MRVETDDATTATIRFVAKTTLFPGEPVVFEPSSSFRSQANLESKLFLAARDAASSGLQLTYKVQAVRSSSVGDWATFNVMLSVGGVSSENEDATAMKVAA